MLKTKEVKIQVTNKKALAKKIVEIQLKDMDERIRTSVTGHQINWSMPAQRNNLKCSETKIVK